MVDRVDVDLAHIAQTSYGIAQSPPASNGLATSPNKTKGGNMGYFVSPPFDFLLCVIPQLTYRASSER